MSLTSRFFDARSVSLTSKPIQTPIPITVGGKEDNVFRAVAVAMVNNILVLPRSNRESARKLIEMHAKWFPQQHVPGRLITPEEHFSKLVVTPIARATIINELSLLLRLFAVKECCDHPEQFAKVFREQIEPKELATPGFPIDADYALAAISQAMNLPIKVQKLEAGKELPQRDNELTKVKTPMGSPFTLQKQDGQYLPLVNDAHHYQFLKNHRFEAPKLKAGSSMDYPSLAEIQAVITPTHEQLMSEYEQNTRRLSSMLKAGEITRDTLREIYIKSITVEENNGPIGTEHGHQVFFDELTKASGGLDPVNLPAFSNHEEQVTQVYVSAVARGMSLGLVNSVLLDNALDDASYILK